MKKAAYFLRKSLTAVILAGIFGCSGSETGGVSIKENEAVLEVSPLSPRGAKGTVVKLSSTVIDEEGSKEDVSATAAWSSSNGAIVAVSDDGYATCLSEGTAVVTAVYGGMTATAKVSVTSATVESIEVIGGDIAAVGFTKAFRARALLSDGTSQDITDSVTWSTDPLASAIPSNAPGSRGTVQFVAAGAVTVSAAFSAAAEPVTGTTDVTVTDASLNVIEVTPTNGQIAGGTSTQMQATGIFSDGTRQDLTTQATWSGGGEVASVSNALGSQGVVTGNATGSAPISAAMGGVTGSTNLAVSDATLQSLQVTPTNGNMGVGTTMGLNATGIFSDNTRQDLTNQVRWSAAAPAVAGLTSVTDVAGVSNATGSAGTVTGLGGGTATISAARGGITGSTGLNVTSAPLTEIQVTPNGMSMAAGTIRPFTATGIYRDMTRQNLTSQVTWGSTDTGVMRMSNAAASAGQGLGTGAGGADVTATLGNVTGGTGVNVTDAALSRIDITPGNASTAAGVPRTLAATGVFSDGTRQDLTSQVTWGSGNRSIAAVSNAAGSAGIASPLTAGSTPITATMPAGPGGGENVTGTTGMTVTDAALTDIEVTPFNPTLPAGINQQFSATGLFSNGTTQDLTPFATWQTGNSAIAAATNAGPSPIAPAPGAALAPSRQPIANPGRGGGNTLGTVAGLGAGTTPVNASFGGVTGGTPLRVSGASLTGLEITPLNTQFAAGTSTQFNATGIFSDLTRRDLTNQVTWTSSNPSIAAVSNAAGTQGMVYGAGSGTSVVSASRGGITASAVP